MAGALSSLGGNVSAMSVNPASSASFKKSVFELSPAYIYAKSENYYHGYDKAFSTALKMPSMGLVYYKPMAQNDIFVSGLSFAFSYNAQNRYSETLFSHKYNHGIFNNIHCRQENYITILVMFKIIVGVFMVCKEIGSHLISIIDFWHIESEFIFVFFTPFIPCLSMRQF